MSDPKNAQDPAEQDGAVQDVDDPKVEADTDSGGAPEDPDTDPTVYDGGASDDSGS